jgi:glycosyltransferase involved in cell wall biosynthesis
MDRKKVLQLRSSFGFFGAENVIVELVTELIHTKYLPVIGALKSQKYPHLELVDFANKNNIESVVFDCRRRFDLKTIFSIRSFIKKNKIDIIQTHGYKSNFYAFCASLFTNIPLIATCHPWIKTNRWIKFYTMIDKLLLKKFDQIITISEGMKQEILNTGIDETRLHIIDNGINIERFKKKYDRKKICAQFSIPINSKVIGTISRLTPEKGHYIFIEAAEKIIKAYPLTLFVIAGDGILENELKQKAEELKISDRLIFTGLVDNIPELLSLFDIFVLPSLTEGFPMALLEAMAAKIPVIASKVGAIPKLIIHNKSGLLVEPQNISSLEKAIVALLNNKDKANRFARNGYKIILKNYSSKIMTRKYMDIYDTLLYAV